VTIEVVTVCPECGKADDKAKCPKCGAHILPGYGLAGGGVGFYEVCAADGCDYFSKVQDGEE